MKLVQSEVLQILVGQQGQSVVLHAGGGGGRFVVDGDNTPLSSQVVAEALVATAIIVQPHGSTGTDGKAVHVGRLQWKRWRILWCSYGSGGGGFSGAEVMAGSSSGGISFLNGGAGGQCDATCGYNAGAGGFGGGGELARCLRWRRWWLLWRWRRTILHRWGVEAPTM